MSLFQKRSARIFFIFLSCVLTLFLYEISFANTSDLTVQDYQLVSKTRVGRTAYDYVFKANIKNNGTQDALNVSANLTSLAATTTVIESSLTFGIIPAGAVKTSSDTFTVRINLVYPFNASDLEWDINAMFPESYEIIGSEGGLVEVSDASSELLKTKVDIPPHALSSDMPISITFSINQEYTDRPLEDDTTNAGPIIDLGPDGAVFNSNVTITIPYDDKDNDGIIDYTDTSEDEISVVTWDKNTHAWVNIPIISQDKQNKTVSFLTNHFSKYTTSIRSTNRSKEVFIFAIDGLKFVRTFGIEIPLFPYTKTQGGYLKDALLKIGVDLKKNDVYSYGWDRDAKKTANIISDLKRVLYAQSCYAKANNKKFILVTHSWGTILGMLGLQYEPCANPDLFITLSSPFRSINASPTPTIDELIIYNYTKSEIDKTYKKNGSPARNIEDFVFLWTNYWAWGDLISGPLNRPFTEDVQVDKDYTTYRVEPYTVIWHRITTLDFDFFSYSTSVKNTVKDKINDVIDNNVQSVTTSLCLLGSWSGTWKSSFSWIDDVDSEVEIKEIKDGKIKGIYRWGTNSQIPEPGSQEFNTNITVEDGKYTFEWADPRPFKFTLSDCELHGYTPWWDCNVTMTKE